ncbi:MAG: Hsp20/alpha crystallin family protein [Lachnospiraceae bacterium]|nr:Hsp20/alpha crystallin family protein [Lachnospiraceae bacterium]
MLMPSIFGKNLFDEIFDNVPFFDDKEIKKMEKKLYGEKFERMMTTDIKEHENGYELEMDLPGFNKEDIKVSLENGYLTVLATKTNETKEDDKSHYIHRERYTGSYSRNFYVGDAITEEDIKASFKDGILALAVPKKEVKEIEQKKFISIE